ncbi:MAG: hypothetical protein GX221_08750 [Candidatus Riflebacteria bacterium]|nr:hypothetical protein [Candidatus Riflebacteria bacterium]
MSRKTVCRAICMVLFIFLFSLTTGAYAVELEFDSFEEARAAAEKRRAEYDKRMHEYVEQEIAAWREQQKNVGKDGVSGDISKVDEKYSSTSDGSETAQQLSDKVKESLATMREGFKATSAHTAGHAAAAAGYTIKISQDPKTGKFVIKDSFDEGAFGTGLKKDEKPQSAIEEPVKKAETTPPATPQTQPQPVTKSPEIAKLPPQAKPKTDPKDPGNRDVDETTIEDEPAEEAPPLPPAEIAPPALPAPSVQLVIQHPIDFTEAPFAADETVPQAQELTLDDFEIPEDTRVKITLEILDGLHLDDFVMTVTDEKGESQPISGDELKRYRHIFRVPSKTDYFVNVYTNEGGTQKKILQVAVPVIPMDFDARTMESDSYRR